MLSQNMVFICIQSCILFDLLQLFICTSIIKCVQVEQLHIIFKLCGTPPDDFFKRMKVFISLKPSQIYKSSLREKCKNFPSSAVELLNILLALDPCLRGSASSALDSEVSERTLHIIVNHY